MQPIAEFVFVGWIAWGFYALYLLQKDKHNRREGNWNSARTIPDEPGEYETRHCVGKKVLIDRAHFIDGKWKYFIHDRFFECYVQDRQWRHL